MTTDAILYGSATSTVRAIMPSNWGQPTGTTIAITRDNGTALLAATAATIYAGDTTAAAITAGTKTMTLVTGTALADGDVIHVGSDAYGWHEHIVDSYDSGTKIVTVKDRFAESLPIGAFVKGRWMTYTLDASGSDWDFIGDVSVVWTPAGISALPWTQLWTVLKRESNTSGLESQFQIQFGDFYPHTEGNFNLFYQSAYRMISQKFRGQGRDIRKMVDSAEFDYLIMTRIALNIAIAHGDSFDDRTQKLQLSYDDQIATLATIYQWDDTDQDLTEEDDEVNKAAGIGYARGY